MVLPRFLDGARGVSSPVGAISFAGDSGLILPLKWLEECVGFLGDTIMSMLMEMK